MWGSAMAVAQALARGSAAGPGRGVVRTGAGWPGAGKARVGTATRWQRKGSHSRALGVRVPVLQINAPGEPDTVACGTLQHVCVSCSGCGACSDGSERIADIHWQWVQVASARPCLVGQWAAHGGRRVSAAGAGGARARAPSCRCRPGLCAITGACSPVPQRDARVGSAQPRHCDAFTLSWGLCSQQASAACSLDDEALRVLFVACDTPCSVDECKACAARVL